MVDVQRDLEALRELQAGMQVKTIVDLIRPRHPQLANVRLRVGFNKRRQFTLFEPLNGHQGPDAWRQVGPCPKRLCAQLQPHLNDLEERLGPSVCRLLYHPDEPQEGATPS